MKKPSAKRLTTILDGLIRDIFKVKYLNPYCVTCGKKTGWFHPRSNRYGIQVGHYISRTKFCLRWDLKNCKPQCSSCNMKHEQNSLPFTQWILKTYGRDRLDYFEKVLKEYETGKWSTFTRKMAIKEELEQTLEKLKTPH